MPPRPSPWRRAGVTVVVTVLAVVAGLAVVGVLSRRGVDLLPFADRCSATVRGHTATLDREQAENASLIVAVSVRRGLPPRAASIALATAFQESKLHNLDHGDRDSLGLFQQRPSQGWGTPAQVMDPLYATRRFYDALVKVPGYRRMEITRAAQEVQRSGFPRAYAVHEADARTLASALTGETNPAAFNCTVRHSGAAPVPVLGPDGLTAEAATVRRELRRAFGDHALGGFAPGGVSSGHMRGSAHYDGRAIDVLERPVGPKRRRHGWAVAGWAVANAERLGIQTVIFDGRIWSAGLRSRQGWRDYQIPSSSRGSRRILMHRDHVHIDVRS